MFNSNVDLGFDSNTGKYIFAVMSSDGKSWINYDVTDLIARVLKHETEVKKGIGYTKEDIRKSTREIGFLKD